MLAQMLAPAAVLVLWSLIMMYWLAWARFPVLKGLGNDSKLARPGGRGQDLEDVAPAPTVWKSHNYTHLMEQPTIFYPTVVILALTGAGAIDVLFAWIYVALRIVHSIWQATVNVVRIRFLLFIISSFALTILAVRAVIATLNF